MPLYHCDIINRRTFLASGVSVGLTLLLAPLVSLQANDVKDIYEPEAQRSTRYQVVRYVQMELQKQGYNPGMIDGKIGARTRKSLMHYQEDHNLPVTGEIDTKTLEALKLPKN